MTLTAGSLFSGIGGLDLGASLAGFDIQFHVEIDEFCRKVLNKHANRYWPNAKQFADVRTVGKHNLPTVDCLFGGFPCQDISYAGRGAGIREGTRSGLWLEFKRVISEIRPTVVLLENVPAILTRDGTLVVADLASMGYVGRWGIISAKDAGAPHQRERWFLVAYSSYIRQHAGRSKQSLQGFRAYGKTHHNNVADTSAIGRNTGGDNRQERHLLQHVNGDAAQSEPERQGWKRGVKSAAETMGNTERSGRGRFTRGWTGAQPENGYTWAGRAAQPGLGGTPDGLPGWLDFAGYPARPSEPQFAYEPPRVVKGAKDRTARIKALGNAVVPQVAYPIFAALMEWFQQMEKEQAA